MAYLINLTTFFVIYAILGVGLNLITGYTGLVSLSQAAFYAIGAYTTAILLTMFGINFFVSVLVGIGVAAIISFLIGIILSKFDGDFFVLGTLGFNAIIFGLLQNWHSLTKGPVGIAGIYKPALFGIKFTSPFSFLILSLVFLTLIYCISHWIVHSSFGRVLKAIREDEKAIQIFGYNTLYFKLAIFVIGSSMAAVAGSLFASYISFIDPTSFAVSESIFIITIIILGGLANLRASLVGAFFLIFLPEALRFAGFPTSMAADMRQVIYGLLLIILMLYRPQGLIGEYKL